jgi:hypothetical protein
MGENSTTKYDELLLEGGLAIQIHHVDEPNRKVRLVLFAADGETQRELESVMIDPVGGVRWTPLPSGKEH